jgi:hypothetical protein
MSRFGRVGGITAPGFSTPCGGTGLSSRALERDSRPRQTRHLTWTNEHQGSSDRRPRTRRGPARSCRRRHPSRIGGGGPLAAATELDTVGRRRRSTTSSGWCAATRADSGIPPRTPFRVPSSIKDRPRRGSAAPSRRRRPRDRDRVGATPLSMSVAWDTSPSPDVMTHKARDAWLETGRGFTDRYRA